MSQNGWSVLVGEARPPASPGEIRPGGKGDIQLERVKDKRDEPSFGMKLREYE